MITDVLYGVNMYILFCVKLFELNHVMDIALQKCYVLFLLLLVGSNLGHSLPFFTVPVHGH